MRRLLLLLPVLLLFVIAACGPATAPADETAEETEQATEEATPEATEDDVPAIDLPGSAPELEALLPDEIGGQEVLKLSFTGVELMTDESGDVTVDPEFLAFLDRMGAQPDDVSMAMSFALSEEGQSGVVAFRVAGADGNQLRDELEGSMEAEEQVGEWTSGSVGGKSVVMAEDLETTGNTVYIYVRGDMVFMVTAADEATATEILSALP